MPIILTNTLLRKLGEQNQLLFFLFLFFLLVKSNPQTKIKNVFSFAGAKVQVAVTEDVSKYFPIACIVASALIGSFAVRYLRFDVHYIIIQQSTREMFDLYVF